MTTREARGAVRCFDGLPEAQGESRVIGPYGKVLAGRAGQITSVSVVLHNAKGAPRGLLCINFDRSPLDGMIDQLVRFAAPVEDRPAELFEKDWRERDPPRRGRGVPLAPVAS